MIILGVDVGFRNFGFCLAQVNGQAEVITKGTLNLGSTKEWRQIIPAAVKLLGVYTHKGAPDIVAIEELVWYGKRKGVLGLAHLAGAVGGGYSVLGSRIEYFRPQEVKAATQRGRFPKDFTEHEKDSLSLCRLALDKWNVEAEKLANSKKIPRRPIVRR